jgi:hypothetical protein
MGKQMQQIYFKRPEPLDSAAINRLLSGGIEGDDKPHPLRPSAAARRRRLIESRPVSRVWMWRSRVLGDLPTN